MKKMADDDIGILITREMKSMLADQHLTYEQRGRIMCAIICADDMAVDDIMMKAFADSLKVGYNLTNNKRKAEIYARRERQKAYAKNLRTSTEMFVDKCKSTKVSVDERASLNRTEHIISGQKNIVPLNPPQAGEGEEPSAITADELMGNEVKPAEVDSLMEFIEHGEAFGHMRVNTKKLRRCLISILKKNCAAEVRGGIERWTAHWAEDEWRYVPGRITDWLYDGKYLEEPRKKTAAAEEEVVPEREIAGADFA